MSGQSVVLIEWTPEQDDILRLHYRKTSATELAKRFGKTRNAVIGRANRLGLCLPYREKSGFPVKIRFRPPKVIKPVRPPKIKVIPLNGVGVKIWELEQNHCRWVAGEPQDLLFCGHDKEAGSSYCPTHTKLAKQESK